MIVLGTYDIIIYLLCGIATVLTLSQLLILRYLCKKRGNKK